MESALLTPFLFARKRVVKAEQEEEKVLERINAEQTLRRFEINSTGVIALLFHCILSYESIPPPP